MEVLLHYNLIIDRIIITKIVVHLIYHNNQWHLMDFKITEMRKLKVVIILQIIPRSQNNTKVKLM